MKLINIPSAVTVTFAVIFFLIFFVGLVFGVGKGLKNHEQNNNFFQYLCIAGTAVALINAVMLVIG